MKRTILAFAMAFLMLSFFSSGNAEESRKLPSIKVKNLSGEMVSSADFKNDGKPFVINFWATWCKPCLMELSSLNDLYKEWQAETGVKIISISIDDSRNSKKVAPLVKGKGWTYEVYVDENSDLKRALNVNNPPHTILCNGKGEIVWEHNGYAAGDEDNLYKEIKKLTDKDNSK